MRWPRRGGSGYCAISAEFASAADWQRANPGTRLAVQTEVAAREERGRQAETYTRHPAHLRLEELAALRDLARNANARLYLDFNGKPPPDDAKGG